MEPDTFDWETVAKMAGELLLTEQSPLRYYEFTPVEWFEWFRGELRDIDITER